MRTFNHFALFLCVLLSLKQSFAQSGSISLTVDKTFYQTDEVVRYSVSPAKGCGVITGHVYVQLLTSNMEPVQQKVVKVDQKEVTGILSLAKLDTGYYIVQAFSSEMSGGVAEAAIGVNIPPALQPVNRTLSFMLYPESGRVLLNHMNRFAIYLQTQNGLSIQEKIIVKNKAGEVIAIASTGENGWHYIDMPVLSDETLSFVTAKGEILKVLQTNSDKLITNNGFALMAQPAEKEMVVEMRRGEGEQRRKAVLEVFYNELLLHDATAFYNGDTTIVETRFSTKGLENKLLRLVLKDASGSIVSERLVLMPVVKANEDAEIIRAEINCRADGPLLSGWYSSQPDQLSMQLIPFQLKQAVVDNNGEGFTLLFKNKRYASKTIDYAILQGDEDILQAGEITADSNGVYRINRCDFSGEAVVQFYEEGKQVKPFGSYLFPTAPVYSIPMAKEKMAMLMGVDYNNNYSSVNVMANTLYTPENTKELDEVSVVASRADRMKELEDKYVNNGLFRDFTARSVNVEDDNMAVSYKLGGYLVKHFSGLTPSLNFRGGYLDFYLDEMPEDWRFLKDLSMADIGYIKFYINPVRGGMAAQKGGALLRGDSYAAGIQGSVAVYTKKYSEPKVGSLKGLVVTGYTE